MFEDYSGFDGSGELMGDGLDSSALDLSGSSALDDLTYDSDPLQGSSLSLNGDWFDSGVTDPLDDMQQASLSGVSDSIASDIWDTGDSDTNGSGSAQDTHALSFGSAADVNSFFGAVNKFGTGLGSLFFPGSASARPVVAGRMPNVNPNRRAITSIASGHAVLLVGLVVVVGGAIVLGGKS
jgi:hypothetical protein